ncbi:MAG TPA: hypothetical protein VFV32_13985 [Acidimicrobiales bacterium]|jgi:hypothetical protein|nr:hypothetical protein [Acidimicrobiales bacterium]
MTAYGVAVCLVGLAMTYGELTAWNSMVGLVPGIIAWPAIAAVGLALAIAGRVQAAESAQSTRGTSAQRRSRS